MIFLIMVNFFSPQTQKLASIKGMGDQGIPDRKHFENAFPKKCNTCGGIYFTYQDFNQRTDALEKGQLSQGPKQSVLAYRNCKCKSTLTIKPEDLRDQSEEGVLRRKVFREKLTKLTDKGTDYNEAVSQVKKEMGL